MKPLAKIWSRIKGSLRKIHLIDKCLIIIMAVLMIQTAYNLFVNSVNTQDTSTIDVIVRTSAASIFGYFLSANFIKKNKSSSNDTIQQSDHLMMDSQTNTETPKNAIGFNTSLANTDMEAGHADSKLAGQNNSSQTSHLQIIIATTIGIFSLCVLLALRNFGTISPSAIGTLSQLRDFVSGCIGFLLGCATHTDDANDG